MLHSHMKSLFSSSVFVLFSVSYCDIRHSLHPNIRCWAPMLSFDLYLFLFVFTLLPRSQNKLLKLCSLSNGSQPLSVIIKWCFNDFQWTEDDLTKLVNAVARYPGGVSGRWEKIAEVLDRPIAQVTSKAKEMGSTKLRYFYEKSMYLLY